ncbi:MAG: M20/M25/M40 family metallo-hydrolase [bacterium]
MKDELNALAEKSEMEYHTSDYILRELNNLSNAKVLEVENSCSLLAIFQTGRIGKTVLLRADIDAILFDGDYRHLCGHDGHTAVLLSLAKVIDSVINKMNGTVILLFQAAEETGKGAYEVVSSGILKDFTIDYFFAMHNLPGFPLNSVVISNGIFAKASSGIKINLIGQTSHAANPANGYPMDYYIINIINQMHKLAEQLSTNPNDLLLTLTHINFGKPNFGTILNEAVIYGVIRSTRQSDIESYKEILREDLSTILSESSIKSYLEFHEEFPVTENSAKCVDIIKEAVRLPIVELSEPFSWSEDFGHFSKIGDICLFGLGIGENASALHTAGYAYTKECLTTAVETFYFILFKTNRI